MTTRGTTNTNVRGSAADRRNRKRWLLDTFGDGETVACYRCAVELDYDTLTVDRIVPACFGGTYVRGNIRPACMTCNIETGAEAREEKRRLTNWTAPKHKRGCLHCQFVAEYRLARHAYELRREAVTGAYASEEAEYDEQHEAPTYKAWLIAGRGRNEQGWEETA